MSCECVENCICTKEMDQKVARPMADKIVHLMSRRVVPAGFDTAGFAKDSLVETFGEGLLQESTCSSSRRDALGPTAKRRRCSVVDAALGIMGYDSLKVDDTKGRFLVDMLTSLIRSKSSCGGVCGYLGGMDEPNPAPRSGKCRGQFCGNTPTGSQRLPVGVLLQIVENCKSFFASMKDYGTQAQEVVDALVELAADTCLFYQRAESISGVFHKAIFEHQGIRRKDIKWAVHSVIDFALQQNPSIYSKLRPCGRLRFWRIRPACLKQDISRLANEAILRLLLPLDRELCQREEWAILIVSLSLAPEMFMEARRLLHHWLLSSGAVRLWELRGELVASVRDVVSHPTVWGLTNVIHLPPNLAFYSVALSPFVQILEEPPTILGMLRLLKLLSEVEVLQREPTTGSSGQSRLLERIHVDHNSVWSLLIEFLPWFLFASKLLFRNFKPTSTCTAEREMYESLVDSGKCEGVIPDSEYDFQHCYQQAAAKYLAWIINPADRLQRACDEQILLSLSRSWGNLQEGLWHASSSRFRGHHEYGALTAAVRTACIKCIRCGSPVKKFTTFTVEADDRVCGKKKEGPSNYGMESSITLNLWLAHVQRNFTATKERSEDGSRTGRSSTTSHDSKRGNFMAHYLPLAALSESLNFCTTDTVISVLQFVASCEGDYAPAHAQAYEANHEFGGLSLAECYSCTALLHNERCRSQDCKEEPGHSAATIRSEKEPKDSIGASKVEEKKVAVWIPGVAAVFRIIDSLDGDDLLFADMDPAVVDPTGEEMRATSNLVVIVAEFVQEWAKSCETFFSNTLPRVEDKIYNLTLKDMHCRFCRWIRKLSLSSEAVEICNDVVANLATKMNVCYAVL